MTLVGQFTILQKELRNIDHHIDSSMDEDKICLRFNECVRKHQELIACAENVKDLYKNIVVGFVVFLSVLICMELYQVMTVTYHQSNHSCVLSFIMNKWHISCVLFISVC